LERDDKKAASNKENKDSRDCCGLGGSRNGKCEAEAYLLDVMYDTALHPGCFVAVVSQALPAKYSECEYVSRGVHDNRGFATRTRGIGDRVRTLFLSFILCDCHPNGMT
jgi:hypothetical protein